jgi:hypothetical protein
MISALVICYLVVLVFIVYVNLEKDQLSKDLQTLFTQCVVRCPKGYECTFDAVNTRGTDYIYNSGNDHSDLEENLKGCMVTGWNLSHFIFHLFLGCAFPQYLFAMFMLSATFELLEFAFFNCHDSMDILLNTCGLILGQILRLKI